MNQASVSALCVHMPGKHLLTIATDISLELGGVRRERGGVLDLTSADQAQRMTATRNSVV